MNKQRIFYRSAAFVLAALLSACATSPGKLSIRVKSEKQSTQCEMTVTGTNFSPNKSVSITITNFPKGPDNIPSTVTTDSTGKFTFFKDFAFKSVGRDEEFINILVTARDETTGQFAIENTSPEPYLTRL